MCPPPEQFEFSQETTQAITAIQKLYIDQITEPLNQEEQHLLQKSTNLIATVIANNAHPDQADLLKALRVSFERLNPESTQAFNPKDLKNPEDPSALDEASTTLLQQLTLWIRLEGSGPRFKPPTTSNP